jgi:hypothetical protein
MPVSRHPRGLAKSASNFNCKTETGLSCSSRDKATRAQQTSSPRFGIRWRSAFQTAPIVESASTEGHRWALGGQGVSFFGATWILYVGILLTTSASLEQLAGALPPKREVAIRAYERARHSKIAASRRSTASGGVPTAFNRAGKKLAFALSKS